MDYYVEKPIKKILKRRDFLKVLGIGVSTVAMTGYAVTDVVAKRKSYIALRQSGLYKDDKRLQKLHLTSSHQNPSCLQVYKDLNDTPMGEIAEKLLHTSYVDRTKLGVKNG